MVNQQHTFLMSLAEEDVDCKELEVPRFVISTFSNFFDAPPHIAFTFLLSIFFVVSTFVARLSQDPANIVWIR